MSRSAPATSGLTTSWARWAATRSVRFPAASTHGTHTHFSLAQYRISLGRAGYRALFLRSLEISSLVTVITVLLAYPMAYFVAFRVEKHKFVWLILLAIRNLFGASSTVEDIGAADAGGADPLRHLGPPLVFRLTQMLDAGIAHDYVSHDDASAAQQLDITQSLGLEASRIDPGVGW